MLDPNKTGTFRAIEDPPSPVAGLIGMALLLALVAGVVLLMANAG